MKLARRLLAGSPRATRAAATASKLGRYALRRPHEPDFAVFALFGDREGIFLDIGANQGQSAMSFRLFNRRMPIVSIEANPLHERDLRRVGRIVRRHAFHICAAGTEHGSGTLYVPRIRGRLVTGEAGMSREDALEPWWLEEHGVRAEDVEIVEVPVVIRPLDELGLQPAFVKIDIEGAEAQALGGLTQTIERHRPVVFVEDSDQSRDEVAALLTSRGYRAKRYDHATRRLVDPGPGDPWVLNLVYLPEGDPAA